MLWPLTTGNKKKFNIDYAVFSHFVDFYINFALRQWTGRVERAHIYFFSRLLEQPGAGYRAQGGSHPAGAAHEEQTTNGYGGLGRRGSMTLAARPTTTNRGPT